VLGFWASSTCSSRGPGRLWWLVFLGALLAVVALYYYLNVARAMFIDRTGARLSRRRGRSWSRC